MEPTAEKRFLPNLTGDPNRDMAFVGCRLATLAALSDSVPVYRVKLAEAGFYSRGEGEEVICYSCGLRHSGWTSRDAPLEIHRRLRPDCQHAVEKDRERESLVKARSTSGAATRGTSTTTVTTPTTITPDATSAPTRTTAASATITSTTIITNPTTTTTTAATSTSTTATTTSSTIATAITVVPECCVSVANLPAMQPQRTSYLYPRLDLSRAVHPAYSTLQSRRGTFTSWDERQAPPSNSLALAGFFYQGYEDCVACFYCGVRLKTWRPTDDVDREHVRWRPECQYLRTIRGQHHVNQLRASLQAQEGTPLSNNARGPSASTAPHSPLSAHTSGHGAAALTSSATVTSSANVTSSTSGQGASPMARASPAQGSASARKGETKVQRVARLRRENQRLRDVRQCRVCRERRVNIIFLPCAHVLLCDACSSSAQTCLLCARIISAMAKVHLE